MTWNWIERLFAPAEPPSHWLNQDGRIGRGDLLLGERAPVGADRIAVYTLSPRQFVG